jgi:allophanate hydrolase
MASAALAVPAQLSIASLRTLYLSGALTPQQLIADTRQRIQRDSDNPIWITVLDDTALAPYLQSLSSLDKHTHPLWGIPFAIKDNIDLANVPTTVACPAYAYTPTQHAHVVEKLLAAGAIPIGKTNMDQFATGLVGTRSPYGEVQNAFLPEFISGGSSSGSAVALARGHVAFALGTDTAGSGRAPASLNHLVGLKPSRGLLSTRGVVPACRTLDCVSLFTHCIDDARTLLDITQGFDPEDSYSRRFSISPIDNGLSRLKIGVPKPGQLEFFGCKKSAQLFEQALHTAEQLGAAISEIDFSAFREAAAMLYSGPWVAERYHVAHDLVTNNPSALLPVIQQILQSATGISAADMFSAFYRLQDLRRAAEPLLASVDAIMTPTIPRAYTRAEIAAAPIELNSKLGTYTNFMNLLDLAALAIPTQHDCNGLPYGITLFADHGSDWRLLQIAGKLFPSSQSCPSPT